MAVLRPVTEWEVRCGDALEELAKMPDGIVQTVVTSPPYWGLRDYGAEPKIWAKNPDCHHDWNTSRYYVEGGGGAKSSSEAFSEPGPQNADRIKRARWREDDTCSKCGAWRGQLGLEPTPELYTRHLIEVFCEVRRVLRDDGTVWLNLGDSFASGKGTCYNPGGGTTSLGQKRKAEGAHPLDRGNKSTLARSGLKPKDLCMIPARVAMALQADGWWLRMDIIWNKPNPMPESITDRPTRSHEYLFLLSKSQRYFYDTDAIKEATTGGAHPRGDGVNPKVKGWKTPDGWDTSKGNGGHGSFHKEGREKGHTGYKHKTRPKQNESFSAAVTGLVESRNKRSVWTIPTEPFPDAHFAVFPTKLVEPCILAGTSKKGQCPECGSPWVQSLAAIEEERTDFKGSRFDAGKTGARDGGDRTQSGPRFIKERIGWQPTCSCSNAETEPQLVLDPFCGSGTVGVVALRHGRRFIGIDLSSEYCEMARRRIDGDAPLFNRVED